jgi:hypothetical protein
MTDETLRWMMYQDHLEHLIRAGGQKRDRGGLRRVESVRFRPTSMNFSIAKGTSDQLSVSGGTLSVAGNLDLSGDKTDPDLPLAFFADTGATPTIDGAFASITTDIPGSTATWRVDNGQPGGTSYGYVTIS